MRTTSTRRAHPKFDYLEERLPLSAPSEHVAGLRHAHGRVRPTTPVASVTDYVSWGLEDWQLGQSNFTIQLGDGTRPIRINSITAAISASAMPLSDPNNGFQRQTLFAISPTDSRTASARIIRSPHQHWQRWEHSVAHNLLAFDLKQTRSQIINYSMTVNFRSPVKLLDGKLTAFFDNETYTPVPSVSHDPAESLDTEVHLIIQYQY